MVSEVGFETHYKLGNQTEDIENRLKEKLEEENEYLLVVDDSIN